MFLRLVFSSFFFAASATPAFCTLSLHDALPICLIGDVQVDVVDDRQDPGRLRRGNGDDRQRRRGGAEQGSAHSHGDRKSTRLNSSHRCISYAVFCLKKKNKSKVCTLHIIQITMT